MRSVTGQVQSAEEGTALPGVNVIVKGTTTGTVTDNEGRYTVNVTDGGVLVFSFIGYLSQEVPVNQRTVIDVRMDLDVRQLGEVVVVGYGTQIKQDLTGNIAQIKGEDVQNLPVVNLTQTLQGRAAGVFVENESGKVGEGIKVRIRGTSSISASNEPLYVVDGIPINTSTLASSQNGATVTNGSALASINFNDVESFEILKDASAAAIYGSRAANGVVLITTKRGRAGKTQFNANFQYGVNKPTNDNRGFLNASEYISFFREAAENGARYDFREGISGYLTEQDAIDDYVGFVESRFTRYSGYSDWRNLETNTNWEKEAFQDNPTAFIMNLSAAGGNDKTRFYVSGEYTDQEGILIANSFERLSSRINLDQDVGDRFKFGVNMSFARTETSRLTQDNDFGTPMQIVALAPITPIRDLEGRLYDRPVTTYYNPLLNQENGQYFSTTFRNLGGVFGQLSLAHGFYLRSELAFDLLTQNDEQFFGSRTQSASTDGFGQSDWLRVFNYNTNNFLGFNKKYRYQLQHRRYVGHVVSKVVFRPDTVKRTGVSK